MKDKKAFVFGILGIIYLTFIVAILILLIILGFKINDSLIAFWDFLKTWYWVIALSITGILFRREIGQVIRFIFTKIGIK